MSIITIVFVVAFCAYLAAGGLYSQQFFKQSNKWQKLSLPLLIIALVCHLGLLHLSARGHTGEQLSLSFVAAMLAWLVTLTMLIAHRYIKNLLFLPIVCFLSSLFISLEYALPATTGISVEMSSGMIAHILLSLIAYGILSISMLYACQLAYINHQLKHKSRLMLMGKLPPLMSVETILYQLMNLGTGMLGISLVSGFVFLPSMFSDGYAHKTLLSIIALAIYFTCLVLHKFIGLKARVTIIFNLVGLGVLTLAYFGSRLVREWILT